MSFKIIKDAGPLPKRMARREILYPFAEMDIGDAFDAPRDKGKAPSGADRRQGAIAGSANAWARRHNPSAKFTVRRIDEHTVRCWRIA